jgi:predicted  nucleic acid-binding Zn-ribbon protein
MLEHGAANRGELAKAELTLQVAETKLEDVRALLAERKAERIRVEADLQTIAANGDMQQLVASQSRAVSLDKIISQLTAAEVECIERVDSARRYLYTLYVRLEKLRHEFSLLMRQLASRDQGDIPSDVVTSLGRIKIQLKAITGENSTGRL